MRIDDPGQNHAAAAIDFNNLLAILPEPRIAQRVFRSANRDDLAAKAEHGTVLDNSEFGKESTASRSIHHRRPQCEKLADVGQ
jgi:hypothetical protein